MYQVEFERIQNEFNCKIPFILKELLMMTRHFNDESNGGTYSYSQYPAHWFNPIKSWKKEGNIVRISNCVGLVPNGKYNNLLLLISEFSSEVDLNYSLFYPNSSLFKIQGDSFPKYCKLDFNRGFAYSTSNITSIPLALCALKYFTTIDLSPRRISLLISRFSPDLFSNKEFLWKAVNIYYKIGEQIPETLLNDRDFCLRLVRSHGKALKYCTKFVKDKEIVTQALKQNGFAIKYISSQYLRYNQDLLEIAVESKPFSLNYVQNSTRNFKSMVIKALQNMKEMTTIPLFVDNDEFLQDKEIVEIILMKNPKLMEQMPNIWRECRPLARKMLSTKSSITGFSQKVIEDPRFFKMVAETKPTLLIEEKKDTSKLVKKVMNAWGLQFNHRDDEETMTKILELARKNPDIYSFMLQMPRFGCGYSDSLRFTFLKEGVSHDPLIICNKRVRNIVSLIDLEQQEEILKIFLNNRDNSKTISVTLSFDKQLLKKYALEGYKKGIKLCKY
ncbi:predicted protein [Naegleria gruberi]|uniref:Predicted protein n=1 Tax=Naegleria gruberi TaxID=5762 RepID=D2VS23_NAEGR|nr:uncharacterized protein NAEGRDRAFT_71786 [Naegleria gruberi]EFC40272.1 predicted protein [Naegleria gruberi]|eukprot:XP_002673016.1 predicted protein [Naegleria gruberi strain NEG-M]